MDMVGEFLLADGSHAKALTGIDDHSRFVETAPISWAIAGKLLPPDDTYDEGGLACFPRPTDGREER
jgi:hypothetical protein